IVTAKAVATLDRISNGRVLFGIGGGWNAEEMENHGTDFKKRWRVLRERVLAMKEIWTKEEAEFHGEFVRFDKIWSHPKPVQKPHPPVIMGGDGPKTFDRVIDRKSTRLNSSHVAISYAVFCLKKKKKNIQTIHHNNYHQK